MTKIPETTNNPDPSTLPEVAPSQKEETSPSGESSSTTPSGSESKLSRRGLLAAALGGAAVTVKTAPRSRAAQFAQDWVYHLLNRISHGYSLDEADAAATLGFQGYLDLQLDPDNISEPAFETFLQNKYPTVYLPTSQDIYDVGIQPGNANLPNSELIEWATFQYIFSKKLLFNRLVNCWSNHFSIHIENAKWLKTLDDRTVIRANALGLFPRMLDASMRSAAMYSYLDNQSNHKDAPNENYARELMELHTLGVDGPYTEDDVKEVSRAMTGMHYSGPPNYGEFKFNVGAHDDGGKTVLNRQIPPGLGVGDIAAVATILWTHNSTKMFIAKKLICWLLEDVPDPQLVIDVAREYDTTDGDIEAMVRVILTPANIQRASMTPRFRTGFDWLAGLIRASNIDYNNVDIRGINGALSALAHRPFQWGPPNGYPKAKTYWAPNQITRWRTASQAVDPASAATNYLGFDINDVFAPLGGMDPNFLVRQVNTLYAHDNLSLQDLQALQAYVNQAGPVDDQVARDVISLVVSAPSFQLF